MTAAVDPHPTRPLTVEAKPEIVLLDYEGAELATVVFPGAVVVTPAIERTVLELCAAIAFSN